LFLCGNGIKQNVANTFLNNLKMLLIYCITYVTIKT